MNEFNEHYRILRSKGCGITERQSLARETKFLEEI